MRRSSKAASQPQPRTSVITDEKVRARCAAAGIDAVIGTGDSEGRFVTVVGDFVTEFFWDDRADAIDCALDLSEHIRTTAKNMSERDADSDETQEAASKPQPRTSVIKDKKVRAKCAAAGVDAVADTGDYEGMFATVVGDSVAELVWEDRADAIGCALDLSEHIRTTVKKMSERDAVSVETNFEQAVVSARLGVVGLVAQICRQGGVALSNSQKEALRRAVAFLERTVRNLEQKTAQRRAQTESDIRGEKRTTSPLRGDELRKSKRQLVKYAPPDASGAGNGVDWKKGGARWKSELERVHARLRKQRISRRAIEGRVSGLIANGQSAWNAFLNVGLPVAWLSEKQAKAYREAEFEKQERRRSAGLRQNRAARRAREVASARKRADALAALTPEARLLDELNSLNTLRAEQGLRALSREELMARRKAFPL